MIITAIIVASALIFLSAFCMFGENVTMRFDRLDDNLYQCNWYLLPIGMQRMLITVMANTQRTAAIIGYGNFECTRERLQIVNRISIDFKLNKMIKFSSIQFKCSFSRLVERYSHISWHFVKSPECT